MPRVQPIDCPRDRRKSCSAVGRPRPALAGRRPPARIRSFRGPGDAPGEPPLARELRAPRRKPARPPGVLRNSRAEASVSRATSSRRRRPMGMGTVDRRLRPRRATGSRWPSGVARDDDLGLARVAGHDGPPYDLKCGRGAIVHRMSKKSEEMSWRLHGSRPRAVPGACMRAPSPCVVGFRSSRERQGRRDLQADRRTIYSDRLACDR
jgi:hypothetical protein